MTTRTMSIARLSAICFAIAGSASPLLADAVTDFNNATLNAIRATNTPPPRASRAMAMVSLAVYESVNSIDRTHAPYLGFLNNAQGASHEAAAAQAARDVLVNLFPTQQSVFDTQLNATLAGVADANARALGVALGQNAASAIIASRANDGSATFTPYTPTIAPGRWQPTAPGGQALLPGWGNVTPFAMQSGSQFRPPAPPALNSAEYTAAFNEVRDLGSITSATRTQDQTDIARYWADGGGTATPPGHWNRIASTVSSSQGLSISENARMFAMLNVALADAGIACWDAKYLYDTWRPVTAIRNADTDGNPDTTGDATWTPLLTTPMFPEYTSGHSTFSAAAASVLAAFFGTDQMNFTVSAEGFVVADRSFTSFSQAANEAAMSRLYGGIHFGFGNLEGLLCGDQIGDLVASRYFGVIPTPSAAIAFVLGGVMMGRRRR